MSLLVLSTHPIQYQAPLYRQLQAEYGIPVTVIYASDFSIAGYADREFGVNFAWDTDLLGGYTSLFLSRMAQGGVASPEAVSARGVGRMVSGLNPATILLTGYRPRFDLGAFFYARRKGCPLLFRAETTDHAVVRSRGKTWVRDQFLRHFYRSFSRLLYIGKHSFQHYQRLGVQQKHLVFSPYCVDTSPFQLTEADGQRLCAETRRALNLAAGRQVVLFSGKLVHRKGPDLLLHAAKSLDPTLRSRLTILFLGDGQLRPSLEQLAVSQPAIDTRFVGFQNQRSLSRYYHAADLLAMPSRAHETWGLVVNEALHHGLPCLVSTNVGCAPDLIQPGVTGEIFEQGSVDALKSALERALLTLNRPEVRAQCRTQVSGYTIEKAAHGLASAYRAVTE